MRFSTRARALASLSTLALLSVGLLRCLGEDAASPTDQVGGDAAPTPSPTAEAGADGATLEDASAVDAGRTSGTLDPALPVQLWTYPDAPSFDARDVAVDGAGRILVAGGVTGSACSGVSAFGLVRIAGAAFDAAFGTKGAACHYAGNLMGARAIGLVQDRIVLGGVRADEFEGAPVPGERGAGFLHIARFSPTGTVETVTSFVSQPGGYQLGMHYSPRRVTADDDGILIAGEGFDPLDPGQARGFVQKVAIQGNGYQPAWSRTDGDVFRVAGAERTALGDITTGTSLRATSDFVARRLQRADGGSVATGAGKASVSVGNGMLARAAVAFATASGGTLVVGGRNLDASGKGTGLVAVRFLATGLVDTTFGSGGVALVDDVTWEERRGGEPAAVDAKGRVLALVGHDGGPAVVRLSAEGALDVTFGAGGFAALPKTVAGDGGGSLGITGALAVDPRDDAAVAMLPAGPGFVLARIRP